MKKVSNMSKKLIAILLSVAMTFTPMAQSMPVYAAEVETQNGTENLGTMPEADGLDDAVSDDTDAEEAAGEEQNPDDADADDAAKDDVSDDNSKDNDSDEGKDADTGKVEENTEEKTETKTEAKEDTEPKETVSDPVYEEVLEEESDSASGAEEESETESEEMSQENVGIASFSITESDVTAGGWNESIYAEISKVTDDSAITAVKYSGPTTGELKGKDLEFLVRTIGNKGTRIDIPGLKEGTYELSITVNGTANVIKKSNITVYSYDRSGFAHFNYKDGVGAYNDDGTLKDKAEVLYVTDENKNDVELTVGNITVKGIGNILNSVGQDAGGGKASNGGKANTNQGIIKELAKAGKPLVIRFIGTVSDSGLYEKGKFSAASECKITGLTTYNSTDNGGTAGDNGHMARIQSGKDITIEGIGYDAVIDGWGFHYIAQTSDPNFGKSFEVRNLTFINTPEDAIGMEGQQASKKADSDLTASVERCWIHNNEFYCPEITSPAESDKSEGDGSVDFKRGQYFTCSYNYFDSCHKTNLVGSADYSLQFNLTYHHNYWYMCKARGPLTRRANVHMYNNVWDMQTDYAQNTRADAYIYSEYNIFYACKSPQAVEAGAIKSYNDSIASIIQNKGSLGTVVEDKSEYVSNNCQFSARNIKYDKFDTEPSQSYIPSKDYELQTDFEDMRKTIVSQTGVMAENPKQPDKVAKSEYSVIDRMVNATKATVHQFESLPKEEAPGKISKTVYAFEVGGAFDLTVEYASGSKAVVGVLVNEEGENLLTGDGSAVDLPAGRYMIQAETFQPGDPSKGTIAVFKDMTINSLKITQHDSTAHYHNWKQDSSKSVSASCTAEGKTVYTCVGSGECTVGGTKEEPVPALGHSYGAWNVVKEATETETGLKQRECVRCDASEELEIPIGTSGTGSGTGTGDDDVSGGGSTAAGDYELYFTGLKVNGDTDFFTVNGSYSNSKGSTTVNDTEYKECLKMESKTKLSFSCNDGATLFLAFASTETGKKVKVDGKEYTTDSKGTVTVELSGGAHEITKGDTINLFYVSVSNGASQEVYYTLSFEYNYDDSPDAKTIQAIAGKSYASMSAMVPASFTRTGHTLSGLYTDADCTQAVTYPYVVKANATLYADWEESGDDEVAYSLIFDSNGGSAVATVRIASSQIYEIKQKPTRNGYAFIGWYDKLEEEGSNLVSFVDGSELTANKTVYAHWYELPTSTHTLDCNTAFRNGQDITGKTTISGFTIHALSGANGSTKYYMTATTSGSDSTVKLGTNGVLITDKTIQGNDDALLKSIEFEAKGKGALSVEVELSGNGTAGKKYDIVLAKKTSDNPLTYEEVSRTAISSVTTPAKQTMEFAIDAAGTYYVYPEGDKGVRYHKLTFTEETTEELYTILYQAGIGTAPAGLQPVVKKAGEKITLPGACTAASGYEFKGWSVDGETVLPGTSYTVDEEDSMGGVITIMALYESKSYTLKYDAGEGTLPEGIQNNASVKAGQVIDLTKVGNCIPKDGYEFKGWKVGNSDRIVKSSYTVNATDAGTDGVITLTAVYEEEGIGNNPNPPSDNKKTGMEIVFVNKEKTYVYTGAKIIPEFDVYDYDADEERQLLVQGVDYTVKYTNNVKVSEQESATVTVMGKGNYVGKDAQDTFTIISAQGPTNVMDENLKDLKGAKLVVAKSVMYTGEAQYPEFTLTTKEDGNSVEKTYIWNTTDKVYYDKDDQTKTPILAKVAVSNNINKGTATIVITGAPGKNGKATTIKNTFKILPVDLSKCEVFLSSSAVTNGDDPIIKPITAEYAVKGAVPEKIYVQVRYTPEEGKPEVIKNLEKGRDYTVKYSSNKTVGVEGKIVITGKGNYAKAYKDGKFGITQFDMSKGNVSSLAVYEGMKVDKINEKAATVVDKAGDTLKPSQYTLEVTAKRPAAKANAQPTDLTAADKLEVGDLITVTATGTDTTNLTAETTQSETFTVGRNIAKAKFELVQVIDGKKVKVVKPYTGKEIELENGDLLVTYKGKDKDGKPFTDTLKMLGSEGEGEKAAYEIVSYSNNINKGTATAVIKGTGDYSGTKTIKFKIGQKTLTFEKVKSIIDNLNGLFHE
ncbi:MAG: hypothetical protein HDR19_05995 [Lachnospiraceae bacterium]|nr:hypothetical protein [Lachnospiraceae bacterium]